MTDAKDIAAAPHCPRCGYDLTGQTAAPPAAQTPLPDGERMSAAGGQEKGLPRGQPTAPAPYSAWTDSCPLECTCPECGLRFEWADLLSPPRQRVPWLYEHAKHWWDVRRAWGTCLRALDAVSFWRRVQMHHRASPARLALLVVVVATPLWLASVVFVDGMLLLAASGVISARPPFLAQTDNFWLWLAPATEPFGGHWWPMPRGMRWESMGYHVPAPVWTGGAFALVASITVAAIPSEWRRAGGRPIHLARAGLHTWAPAAVVFALFMALVSWDQCSWNGTLAIGWPKQWNNVLGPPVAVMDAMFRNPTALFLVLLAMQVFAWRQATRCFLRLRSWRTVWLVSAGTGGLASLIVALGTFGWRWLR